MVVLRLYWSDLIYVLSTELSVALDAHGDEVGEAGETVVFDGDFVTAYECLFREGVLADVASFVADLPDVLSLFLGRHDTALVLVGVEVPLLVEREVEVPTTDGFGENFVKNAVQFGVVVEGFRDFPVLLLNVLDDVLSTFTAAEPRLIRNFR
jgi:hypothetical protein